MSPYGITMRWIPIWWKIYQDLNTEMVITWKISYRYQTETQQTNPVENSEEYIVYFWWTKFHCSSRFQAQDFIQNSKLMFLILKSNWLQYLCKFFLIPFWKLGANVVFHPLLKWAQSCKHLYLLSPPDPWNLSGTALLSKCTIIWNKGTNL